MRIYKKNKKLIDNSDGQIVKFRYKSTCQTTGKPMVSYFCEARRKTFTDYQERFDSIYDFMYDDGE